mgnify:CR=1 FL=1
MSQISCQEERSFISLQNEVTITFGKISENHSHYWKSVSILSPALVVSYLGSYFWDLKQFHHWPIYRLQDLEKFRTPPLKMIFVCIPAYSVLPSMEALKMHRTNCLCCSASLCSYPHISRPASHTTSEYLSILSGKGISLDILSFTLASHFFR